MERVLIQLVVKLALLYVHVKEKQKDGGSKEEDALDIHGQGNVKEPQGNLIH